MITTAGSSSTFGVEKGQILIGHQFCRKRISHRPDDCTYQTGRVRASNASRQLVHERSYPDRAPIAEMKMTPGM